MGESSKIKKRILIAGGSGFIGTSLAKKLTENGYDVAILTRNPQIKSDYKSFYWDIYKGAFDANSLNNVDCIINLAGENISNGKWTLSQKQKIEESRVKSAELLFDAVQKQENKPETYISASAIGFYGAVNSDKIFIETDTRGQDFLAGICQKWENSASKFQTLGIRTAILRTGIVFSPLAGAFPQITQTLKFGFISSIGSGKQYMPWIYIDDLVKMYLFAFENTQIQGIYNAVVPEHITQKDLVAKIRHLSGKSFKAPNIPAFLLKAMYGEMALILLYGSRVSPDKILKTGFKYDYPGIDLALNSLLFKTII